MKLKLDASGHVVVENGMPVYIHEDGKEIPFDAKQAMGKISDLSAEAKTHREAKQTAEAELKKFSGITSPEDALKAIETLTKIDQKKLIDAGAVDQVKAEITKSFQAQLDEAQTQNKTLTEALEKEMIGGSFSRSEFIDKKIAIPADFVQSRFGNNFKIEDGKVVAYDTSGNKIYSRTKHGELAGFDEALEFLVEQYPQKDHILKASSNSGGGAKPTQFVAGQKTMKRDAFDTLGALEKQAAIKDGVTIVD